MPAYPLPAAPSLSNILALAEQMRRQQQGAQEEGDRNFARSLTPLIYGATPERLQAEVPASPPVNVRTLAPGEDPEAAAMIPTVPGQPAAEKTISAHTPASLAQAVGGYENFARLQRAPEGSAAIASMRPVSPAELERHQRREQGLLDFRHHSADERERYKLGDIEGGALAHMSAMRAVMDSVDDPTKITLQYERATDRWKSIRSNEEEKRLATEDMKTIAEAQSDLSKNPDDPAAAMRYVTALMEAKSSYARQLSGHLLPEAFKHAQARAKDSRMMNVAGTKGTLKPESINNLTLSIKRLQDFRGSASLSEDDRLQVDQQVADIQGVLDAAISRQRQPSGAPVPAGGMNQATRMRRVPKIGGKTVEVTEPPADVTEDAALAEAQRLMKAYGLNKVQVVEALKRAGWPVY